MDSHGKLFHTVTRQKRHYTPTHVSPFEIHNWIKSLTKSDGGVELNGRTVLALSFESSKACKGDAQIDGYTSYDDTTLSSEADSRATKVAGESSKGATRVQ